MSDINGSEQLHAGRKHIGLCGGEPEKLELKYEYKEDQWSPLNPKGKKQYDRSFLLTLQYVNDSVTKPEGLPVLPDVILDKPLVPGRSSHREPYVRQGSVLDFTRGFMKLVNEKYCQFDTKEKNKYGMQQVKKDCNGGGVRNCKMEEPQIQKRLVLLQKYLDHKAELELQALYALQTLVHKFEHPPGLLQQFFDTLYDEDVISEDAFNQWEVSQDPAEQAGKALAQKSVVQFFTWIRESDEEDD